MIKIPDVIKEYPGYVGKDEYDLEDIKTIYINEPGENWQSHINIYSLLR